ncbi:uncharacterized protein LOC128301752 [Anopheles moucheti]|uniref:uncharacterized protein LOC128301752 n=1 Tax=Anopheles moucheti TaxID=186751 RepID=UPI0022F07703|nr:uncharacterized protein LOC128301752 [Anopheles moucheti]
MATKVIVIAFLCAALVAVVQSAPQYSQGEEPTYDEDDDLNEPVKAHSNADPSASDEEFDPSLLTDDFANAPDPGRRPHFLEQDKESQQPSNSDSSSASAEQ